MQFATELLGQQDLYAALGRVAKQGATLEAVYQELDSGDAESQAVASRLRSVDQGLLRAVMRHGAGLPAIATAAQVRAALAALEPAQMFQPTLAAAKTTAVLTAGERPDMPAFSDRAFDDWFAAQGVDYGLGSYGERRTVYQSAQFADAASPERRAVLLYPPMPCLTVKDLQHGLLTAIRPLEGRVRMRQIPFQMQPNPGAQTVKNLCFSKP